MPEKELSNLLKADSTAPYGDFDIKQVKPIYGPKVFIASPYTLGDVAVNVKMAHDAFDFLLEHGFFPVMPLLAHYQHLQHPRGYRDWIAYALTQLEGCNCMFRIPGTSTGADNEELCANHWKIPVYNSLEAVFIAHNVVAKKDFPKIREKYYMTM